MLRDRSRKVSSLPAIAYTSLAYTSLATVQSILPEIALLATATVVYLVGAFVTSRKLAVTLALIGLLISSVFLASTPVALPSYGPVFADSMANYVRWLALAVGSLLVLLSARDDSSKQPGEVIGSLVLAVAGLMLVSVSRDLVLLFLGLELISIPSYVLLYLGRRDSASQEATTKYFFLSILSSAILLYGFSFLYGIAGSTHLTDVAAALATTTVREQGLASLGPLALALILAGLGFKTAFVPFHFYAPDVYQGTTATNAAMLSILPKAAGFIGLVRVAVVAMPAWADFGWRVTLILAVVTMSLGNILALWQTHVRRMLAYSSIAHSGYLLIGLAVTMAATSDAQRVTSYDGLAAMLCYLLVYSLATVAAFASLESLVGSRGSIERVDDLAGAARRHPLAGCCLAVAMFSLAGVPPLAGFWGKLTLFLGGLGVDSGVAGSSSRTWFLALSVVGVVNAAIAAAYYLRIVGVAFFASGDTADSPAETAAPRSLAALLAAALASVAVIGLGLAPGHFISRANEAARELRGPTIDVRSASRNHEARQGEAPAEPNATARTN